MTYALIITVFVLGYLAIAFEHPLKLNKAASALITGVICWTIYIFQEANPDTVNQSLLHHLGEIASILFFLLGAMTIVELIDSHNGFEAITDRISTRKTKTLLYIIAVLTFFISALLDNLTTAIVMTSLCGKLLPDKTDRYWFAGMIIIAANAGGAWSPLGDVTTTMLWIGGQITALNIIKQLFLPSLAVAVLPTLIIGYKMRDKYFDKEPSEIRTPEEKQAGRNILIAGISLLLFVPFFKTVTHLPPFMGMLLALGFMWVFTTIILKGKEPEVAEKLTVANALQKIDTPSILFFLGILLAVSALQSVGILTDIAHVLSNTFKNEFAIGTTLGILSALVDNVPLVAAAQAMYDLNTYPPDHAFWEFLALATGTGGSAIIIGSAAGVAVMGIEDVSFMWYLRKISLLALLGFAAGIIVFLAQHYWLGF